MLKITHLVLVSALAVALVARAFGSAFVLPALTVATIMLLGAFVDGIFAVDWRWLRAQIARGEQPGREL
jgi:hypothetical protein